MTPSELVERFLPSLADQAAHLTGNSFFDLSPARDLLGFIAERTWRGAMEKDTR